MKDKDFVEIKKGEYKKALDIFSILSKKRGALQGRLAIENDPSNRIKFEAELEAIEIDYNKAEQNLGKLEEEIQKTQTPYTPVTDVMEQLSNYVPYDYLDKTIKQVGFEFASQHELIKETGKLQHDVDKLKNGITVLINFMKQVQKEYGNNANQKPEAEINSDFFSTDIFVLQDRKNRLYSGKILEKTWLFDTCFGNAYRLKECC